MRVSFARKLSALQVDDVLADTRKMSLAKQETVPQDSSVSDSIPLTRKQFGYHFHVVNKILRHRARRSLLSLPRRVLAFVKPTLAKGSLSLKLPCVTGNDSLGILRSINQVRRVKLPCIELAGKPCCRRTFRRLREPPVKLALYIHSPIKGS